MESKNENAVVEKLQVPIWHKMNLLIDEAVAHLFYRLVTAESSNEKHLKSIWKRLFPFRRWCNG